ncbi:MAG: hypothetical protein ACK56F_32450 [bacterium]
MSDLVLEVLSKGEHKVIVDLQHDSTFQTPVMKFKYIHNPDNVNIGTSSMFKTAFRNSKQVFHISVILKDIIFKRLRGHAI